jgi:hypothetical protein
MIEDKKQKKSKMIREALEKYCKLDTYAEILIVEGLKKLIYDDGR